MLWVVLGSLIGVIGAIAHIIFGAYAYWSMLSTFGTLAAIALAIFGVINTLVWIFN